jgi:hypothetical protein
MEKIIQTSDIGIQILEERLLARKFVIETEICEPSSITKIAVSSSQENLEAGVKVVLIFSEELSKKYGEDKFSIEHHYQLDGEKRVLQKEDYYLRPNKLNYFDEKSKSIISSNKWGEDPSEVETFIDLLSDYFERVSILDSKWISSQTN